MTEHTNSPWEHIKKALWTGIAVIFPIYITGYILYLLIRFSEQIAGIHINQFISRHFGFSIPGLGLFILVLILLTAGFLSRQYLGQWFMSLLDRIFQRTPLINHIYPSAKQLSEFLFNTEKKKEHFKTAVLVEYPSEGSYSLGFVTNNAIDTITPEDTENLICVLVPLSPLPFSGLILMVTPDKIKNINITVDQAMKLIVSGGVVIK
ncbi:MAG: DUF502 domain-containing protein [Candidatus Omnitrophota bacterium]